MAKILHPLYSEQASGKLGNTVYIPRGRDTIARVYNPNGRDPSAAQSIILAFCAQATRSWKNLTDAQRDDWTQYALDHEPTDFTGRGAGWSGQNAYVRCKVTQLRYQQNITYDVPSLPPPAQVANLTLSSEQAGLLVTWTPRAEQPGRISIVEVWFFGPHSAGRRPQHNMTKYYGHEVIGTGTMIIAVPEIGTYTVSIRTIDAASGTSSRFTTLRHYFEA